jgi:cyclase
MAITLQTILASLASALALSASLAGFGAPALSQGTRPAPVDSSIKRDQLAPGVYLFRTPSALDNWTATNSTVIINDRDVTVFDANTRPSTSRLVIAEIRKLTDKPVRTLINSHWHMDHWAGNQAYAEAFPGIQIIASTETRDYMKRMPRQYFVMMFGLEPGRVFRLDTASIVRQTGKMPDGSAVTVENRRRLDSTLTRAGAFGAEMAGITQVLPTLAYRDTLLLWSGQREFRLFSGVGDASGATVLYLPQEKILMTGDVLVRTEGGEGAPPWTTNSYRIAPWRNTLRALDALDLRTIVPGQGPALHDKTYLHLTATLFDEIINQVHAALERGAVTLADVQAAVNLDSIRMQFTGGDAQLDKNFRAMTADLIAKAVQEAHDGTGDKP